MLFMARLRYHGFQMETASLQKKLSLLRTLNMARNVAIESPGGFTE